MDVVSPELNSLLPDEIMDTEAIVMEEDPPSQPVSAAVLPEPGEDMPVPMETDTPLVSSLSLISGVPLTQQRTQVLTTATDSSTLCNIRSGSQLLLSPSSMSTLSPLTLRPALVTSTAAATTKTTVVNLPTGGLQKLSAPFTISANHQIILNKVASSHLATDQVARTPGTSGQLLKPEGQKLLVTTIGKSGQPIVLQLPHPGNKPGLGQVFGDGKCQPQQFKVVTIGGRTELKPVMGLQSMMSPASQLHTLQAQQLKTVQIAKKTQVSTSAPIKFIITKTVNSKGMTTQTSVSPVIAGRVMTQSSPVTPPRTITLSESLSASIPGLSSNKIAISPLKSPSKLTVVSVQSPNSPQKSMTLPLNVALGHQQILVQQSSGTSPAKVISSQSQNMKVQTMSVGGVGGPLYKTVIPLASQANVQQIQVPGSRFHYVRLVTATTGNNTVQHATGLSTTCLQTAKPMVVNAGAVRMSVPIIPAQTMKQVVSKPLLTSAAQMLTTQTQQRLIMPATPLAQIQPNLTNLPPGTVLAPAPGGGNMGYAVVPAQYVTQLQQSSFVTLASSSTTFTSPTSIQTQARLPLNGISIAEVTSRPRKPCNCTKSQCLKLYCDCFANGEFCNNCNCNNCFNNLEHETERLKAIKTCLDRNPEAFKPKIGKGKEGESDRRHSKGCNCKRSGCLKNYCECYEAKIMCSSICKCIGCKNFEESPERKTLMHLADAAEVRVQQQTAAKTKLSSQISDLLTRTTPLLTSGGGRMPFTFVTKEVAEATCECLLEQAEQAELAQQPQDQAERRILEEFGRCLMRVISSAGKAKTDCPSVNC